MSLLLFVDAVYRALTFVPSIALLMDSWALLSAPFIMYLMARTLVAKEDYYLTETFGQEYLAYKKRSRLSFLMDG